MLAVRTTEPPGQRIVGPPAEIVGLLLGTTLTVIEAEFVHPFTLVPTT